MNYKAPVYVIFSIPILSKYMTFLLLLCPFCVILTKNRKLEAVLFLTMETKCVLYEVRTALSKNIWTNARRQECLYGIEIWRNEFLS